MIFSTPRRTATGILCLTMIMISLGATAQPCYQKPSGMTTWWPGDATTADLIGSYHGTLTNGAGYATGQVANAFNLDGINDHLSMGNAAPWQFGANDFSMEFWSLATGDNVDGLRDIISLGNGSNWPGIKWQVGYTATAQLRASFSLGSTSPDLQFTSIATVDDNAWHHIVVTRQGDTWSVYIDGDLDVQMTQAGTIPTHAGDVLRIGSGSQGNHYWPGLIDEVSLYSRALTSTEISSIYQAGSAGKCRSDAGASLPYYNVLDYGAMGDGAADDQQAVLDALAAMDSADGGILYFPPGAYVLRASAADEFLIAIDNLDNLTIRGEGRGISEIVIDHNGYSGVGGFYVTNASNMTVRNLTIRGIDPINEDPANPGVPLAIPTQTNAHPRHAMVVAENAPDFRLLDVAFKWFIGESVFIQPPSATGDNNGHNITIEGCYFRDINRVITSGTDNPQPAGLVISTSEPDNLKNVRITDCHFERVGNTGYKNLLGLDVSRVTGLTISGCHFTGSQEAGSYQNSGLRVFNGTTGASIENNSFAFSNVVIGTEGGVLNGNTFVDCYNIDPISNNVSFVGNTFVSETDTGAAYIIGLGSPVKDTLFSGNTFTSTEVAEAIHATNNQGLILTDNTFSGFLHAVLFKGSDKGEHHLVGNTFRQDSGAGILVHNNLGSSWPDTLAMNNRLVGAAVLIEDQVGDPSTRYINNTVVGTGSVSHAGNAWMEQHYVLATGSQQITHLPGGLALRQYTSIERNALSVAAGTMIWDTTVGQVRVYDGTNWTDLLGN